MTLLEWNTNTSGRYISGVSHGVFYGDDGVPIPWNGLISVSEKFQTNEPTPVYNSLGQKYDLHGNVAEKRHSIVCYTYPEEMDEYLGTEYVEEFGFAVDERPPRKFNMAYRSDCDGYYELHVLLGQIATFGDKTHATDTAAPGISNLTMNLQGVPHEVFGSSHLIFDSRNPITASAERILFGTRNTDGDFNDFLNAEVQWIPQAINYAPTIEPDYENRVWLGGDNLANLAPFNSSTAAEVTTLPGVTEYGNPIHQVTRLTGGNLSFAVDDGELTVAKPGDYYTAWVEYEIVENNGDDSHRAWLRLFSPDYYVPNSQTTVHLGGNRYRHIHAWGPMGYDYDERPLRAYLYVFPTGDTLIGATLNIRDYKVEKGDTPTPWTPYVNAPEHQPPSLVPHLVPGVKNASKWNSTNVVPYWDEVTEQLALYSKSPEEWAQSKLSIPLDVSTPIDLKTSADINFGGMVDEEVGRNYLLNSYSGNALSLRSNNSNIYAFEQGVDDVGVYITCFRKDNGNFEVSTYVENVFGGHRGEVYVEDPRLTGGIFTQSVEVMSSEPMRIRLSRSTSDEVELQPNVWTRIEGQTNVQTSDRPYGIFTEESDTVPPETKIYLRKWKFEPGGVATSWSPAPEEALHRRIIGTREPQVLSEQAPNVIGSQTVTLNSTVSTTPQVDIYHNGPVGSDDVRVDNLMVVLQNYQGEFFDGNTVPKTRGERYRRVESTSGYYTVYEHLQFRTQSDIELRTIGTDLYELTGPETQLSIDGDQFTFIGPQATSTGDDTFEIDDTILGF